MLLITNKRCYEVNSKEVVEKLHSLHYDEEQIAYIIKKKNKEEPIIRSIKYSGGVRNPNYISTSYPSYIIDLKTQLYYCKLGFYDLSKNKFIERDLSIGNIVITKIFLWECTENEDIETCFSVFLKEINKDEEVRIDFTEDISYFFNHVIPYLNKRISNGELLSGINLELYAGMIHNIYTPEKVFYDVECAMSLVYNCNLFMQDSKYYNNVKNPKIDIVSEYYYNPYIFGLCSLLESRIKVIKHPEHTIYRCDLTRIPNKNEFNLEGVIYPDLEAKLRLTYYITIYNYFDKLQCDRGWYFNDKPKFEKIHDIKFSNQLLYLYNIISGLKVWHYVNGSTRVGRDDLEWDEDTYVIPLMSSQRLPENLLVKIKEELGLKFIYEDDETRYFYFHRGESDTIPGCWSYEGGISPDRRRKCIIKMLLIIFKMIEQKELFAE